MDKETFNKLYFKAKLGGDKKVGELMIDLLEAGDTIHAFDIHKTFCPGAVDPPTSDNLSKDRSCRWSPYGYCFTNRLGRTVEQFDPESQCCIWCDKIWSVPNTVDAAEIFSEALQLRLGELHRE